MSSGWPTPQTSDQVGHSERKIQRINAGEEGVVIQLREVVQQEERSWPTPTAAEGGKISCQPNYGQVGLSNHPEIQGQVTRPPMEKDGRLQPPSGWPTPTTRDGANNAGPSQFNRETIPLNTMVVIHEGSSGRLPLDSGPRDPASDSIGGNSPESWPTPLAYTAGPMGPNATGAPNLHSAVGVKPFQPSGGKLNPSWVEALMGLPIGWTQLSRKFVKPKATSSSSTLSAPDFYAEDAADGSE